MPNKGMLSWHQETNTFIHYLKLCLIFLNNMGGWKHFANKGPSSQGYGFSSMYGCESWIIKKAEHWRIDAFELWCWRRLLRVP